MPFGHAGVGDAPHTAQNTLFSCWWKLPTQHSCVGGDFDATRIIPEGGAFIAIAWEPGQKGRPFCPGSQALRIGKLRAGPCKSGGPLTRRLKFYCSETWQGQLHGGQKGTTVIKLKWPLTLAWREAGRHYFPPCNCPLAKIATHCIPGHKGNRQWSLSGLRQRWKFTLAWHGSLAPSQKRYSSAMEQVPFGVLILSISCLHFCALISLLSLSQIRCLLKTFLLVLYKIVTVLNFRYLVSAPLKVCTPWLAEVMQNSYFSKLRAKQISGNQSYDTTLKWNHPKVSMITTSPCWDHPFGIARDLLGKSGLRPRGQFGQFRVHKISAARINLPCCWYCAASVSCQGEQVLSQASVCPSGMSRKRVFFPKPGVALNNLTSHASVEEKKYSNHFFWFRIHRCPNFPDFFQSLKKKKILKKEKNSHASVEVGLSTPKIPVLPPLGHKHKSGVSSAPA
jgi:hypothetical protein